MMRPGTRTKSKNVVTNRFAMKTSEPNESIGMITTSMMRRSAKLNTRTNATGPKKKENGRCTAFISRR